MASAASQPKVSYEEYLSVEKSTEQRHEYLRGDVWAMGGGTIEHGRLAARASLLIGASLGARPCAVYSSDVRVRVDATDRTTYPDLSVVCGKVQPSAKDPHAITNPSILIEVLSEGTERSDRGEKFAHYQHLASLQEYVLISQDTHRVEVFRRGEGGTWILKPSLDGDQVVLPSIGVSFTVAELYADPTQPEPR